MGRRVLDIDPASPLAEEMMCKTIADASLMLMMTGCMAIRGGDLELGRLTELQEASEALSEKVMDLVNVSAMDGVESHLLLGQVAINMMVTFINRGQSAIDMAKMAMDLEGMG